MRHLVASGQVLTETRGPLAADWYCFAMKQAEFNNRILLIPIAPLGITAEDARIKIF